MPRRTGAGTNGARLHVQTRRWSFSRGAEKNSSAASVFRLPGYWRTGLECQHHVMHPGVWPLGHGKARIDKQLHHHLIDLNKLI